MTQASMNMHAYSKPPKQRGPLHTEAYEYDVKSNKAPPAGEYLRAPVCCSECEAFWKALILEVDEKHTSRAPAGKASLIMAKGVMGSVLQIKSTKNEKRFFPGLGCKNLTVHANASCHSAERRISSIKSGYYKSPPNRVAPTYMRCEVQGIGTPRRHGHGLTERPRSAVHPEPPEASRRLFSTSSGASHMISPGQEFRPIRTPGVSTPRRSIPILYSESFPVSHVLQHPSSSQLGLFKPPTTEKASSPQIHSPVPRKASTLQEKPVEEFLRSSYPQTPSSRSRSDTYKYGVDTASSKHSPTKEDYRNPGHQNAHVNAGLDSSQPSTPQTPRSRRRLDTRKNGVDGASSKQEEYRSSGHQNADINAGQEYDLQPSTPQTSSSRRRSDTIKYGVHSASSKQEDYQKTGHQNAKSDSPPSTPQTPSPRGRPDIHKYMKSSAALGSPKHPRDQFNPGRGSNYDISRLSRTSTIESDYTILSIPQSDSSSSSQESKSARSWQAPNVTNLSRTSTTESAYTTLSIPASDSSSDSQDSKRADLPRDTEIWKAPKIDNVSCASTMERSSSSSENIQERKTVRPEDLPSKVPSYSNLSRTSTGSSSAMEPIMLFTGHGCCRSETDEEDDIPNYFKHIITNPNYFKRIHKPILPPPPLPPLPPRGLKT